MGLAELGNGGSFDRIGGNYGECDAFYVYGLCIPDCSPSTALFQPITEIITADADGDGKDEFIFGTAEGQIVALRAPTAAFYRLSRPTLFPPIRYSSHWQREAAALISLQATEACASIDWGINTKTQRTQRFLFDLCVLCLVLLVSPYL
jgi:hypothetical protein